VRVRRVNPPEDQRALLRAGQSAPLRMDTPMPLVEILRR
jgi:rare lipoprotein A